MAIVAEEDAKLDRFLQWLQVNGGQLQGCSIKYCGPSKGYGIFSSPAAGSVSDGNGVLMVIPLNLAITPMRVLQDGSLGPRCAEMFKEGHVDDRFLMVLFLTVERLRRNSPWKPYLDMLPSTFSSPLWFSGDELSELKGTSLYQATLLQKKRLQTLFDDKVKSLVEEILQLEGKAEREVQFEDFLWANSVFWTRALNIPFPHSYVFPSPVGDATSACDGSNLKISSSQIAMLTMEKERCAEESSSLDGETVWVEGLIPGIDFCNHGLEVSTTWEVDKTGCVSAVPLSMYLISVAPDFMDAEKEICISYGNKGNEELLYLYGFVVENNPDDYLMVHYPVEALQNVALSDSKAQLLEMQRVELRCLLPRTLLDHGFTSGKVIKDFDKNENSHSHHSGYSWSGQRKAPSYLNKLIFPGEFLNSLRTISLQEHELIRVSELLEQLTGSNEQRQPSNEDVKAAVWEAAGDFGALQLLVDLLYTKLQELEEGSGTEASDVELLESFCSSEKHAEETRYWLRVVGDGDAQMSRNRRASVIYRCGQKRLAKLFLKEAEYILELCSSEIS
ncbi:unnamed protein product [Spirodela intermedia]|uniref:Uncharacterized protein n=1 Tax=Spirodela intermedia TaxID=51605 RepID=A0A7I8IZZ0_SPIIN|nr:unnamed protein product [Spirodela intermedia]CAA6663369.1 unnamed protein product [Spirodela intermedia]